MLQILQLEYLNQLGGVKQNFALFMLENTLLFALAWSKFSKFVITGNDKIRFSACYFAAIMLWQFA
ncbi:hypothetical protein GS682_17370 [Nostoc sp. B(2019)]|nr:hypothetical protein [Nostoc sp. B(2019)]